MQDLYNNVDTVLAVGGLLTNTGSPSQLTSGAIDLQFYEAADVVLSLLDVDELGSSPVGTAKAVLCLDHSDDGTTWSNVTINDVIGPSALLDTNGGCVQTTNDLTTIHVGYRMTKRYIRVRVVPTGLTNGGQVLANVLKGRYRHKGGATA